MISVSGICGAKKNLKIIFNFKLGRFLIGSDEYATIEVSQVVHDFPE